MNDCVILKMLDGNLREIRFSWPEQNIESSRGPVEGEVQEMEQVGTSILKENEVCYINGKPFHVFHFSNCFNVCDAEFR